MGNLSNRAQFETERSLAATSFNGTTQNIGAALTANPIIVVFDNQTDVSVPLIIGSASPWKTFSAGECIVLDLRANHGLAATYTIDIGTQFQTNATVGTTGSFLISVTNAI